MAAMRELIINLSACFNAIASSTVFLTLLSILCDVEVTARLFKISSLLFSEVLNNTILPLKTMTYIRIRPVSRISHDETCFTEGLAFYDNKLYESCGLYGNSSIRVVDSFGNIVQKQDIADEFFVEGITIYGDRLFVNTWENKTMLIFDVASLHLLGSRLFQSATGFGWGLTNDGSSLILSDGSNVLSFFDFPDYYLSEGGQLFRRKQLSIVDGGKPLRAINELEFVDGYVYANVWMQDFIVKIDSLGRVISKFDFGAYVLPIQGSGLRREACLNGVAFNTSPSSAADRFIVTGKLWPQYFKVELSNLAVSDSTRGGMERIIVLMIAALLYITYKAFNKIV